MASTSSSTSSRPTFVLPSIHEMFPEHLMSRSAPRTHPIPIPPPVTTRRYSGPRSYSAPQPSPTPGFSFDVLKSDPRRSSLQHIASSRQDLPPARTELSQPRRIGRAHSFSGSSDGDFEMEVDEEDGEEGDGVEAEEAKKHVCPTCGKRFNRPSSLRIHRNTHTGATPFRCPYPSCGRQFNVNSNMRRHFRNHPTSAYGPSNLITSSPISPSSPERSYPSSQSSHASSSPSSCTSSPTSPPSASWSMSTSSSRYSPATPPAVLPPLLPPLWWGKGHREEPAYRESDVRRAW
ncbi:hypothetical protein DFH06DRAFT_327021 [Mycena polygramma]|nr:hypothetical protein DFH06DRAFT_327021 [Mycena polygramma]